MALTLVSAKRPFAALPERKFTCIALVMQTTAWLARVLAVCAGARGAPRAAPVGLRLLQATLIFHPYGGTPLYLKRITHLTPD